MLRSLTARQLQEWKDYADLEPFGEEREDLRAAFVASWLYNVNRDTKRAPQAAQIKDLYGQLLKEIESLQEFRARAATPVEELTEGELQARRSGRTQTWQEQKAIFLSWAFAQAAKQNQPQVIQGTRQLGDHPEQTVQ